MTGSSRPPENPEDGRDVHDDFPSSFGARPRWLLEMLDDGNQEGLVRVLDGAYPDMAAHAAWALGNIGGPEVVPPLVGALSHPESLVRRAAAEALGILGATDAAGPLRELLEDSDADTRGIAVWSLGGLSDEVAIPQVARLLGDEAFFTDGLGEKEIIGWQAAHTLSLFGEKSYPHLVDATRGGDSPTRRNAAMALGYLETDRAVEPLVALFADPDTEVRRAALNALGDLGVSVPVGPVLELLRDPAPEVRWSAVLLLGNLSGDGVDGALIGALEDPSDDVVTLAAGALASRDVAEALPRLMQLLGEGGKRAAAAARALGSLGGEECVPGLLGKLEEGTEEERAAAASALGRLRALAAVEPLKKHLLDPSPGVRGEVLGALRAITGITFGV